MRVNTSFLGSTGRWSPKSGATKDKVPLSSLQPFRTRYRSGTVNSKSFVGNVLLRIKWKFELN